MKFFSRSLLSPTFPATFLACFLSCALTVKASGTGVFSSPISEQTDQFLADALQIQISDSGLEFISLNIEEILARNGVNLRLQQLDRVDLAAEKPIHLNSIPAAYLGEKATLADLASELPKWISGIALNNPQPTVRLVAPKYEVLDGVPGADRAFFSVTPDPSATRDIQSGELGIGGGVVLELRAHVPILKLSATELRISDPRNPDLRESVLSQPVVTLGGPGVPLELRARIIVRGSGSGRVFVRVLSIDSNIRRVPVYANFSNLRVPQIKITVNGRTGFVMNQKALEGVLRSKLAGLAAIARIKVAAAVSESLPARLEGEFNDLIRKQDLGTTELELPDLCSGADCQPGRHWLRLGLARAVLSPGWGWSPELDHLRLRFFSDWNNNLADSELGRAMSGLGSTLTPEDESIFDGIGAPVDSAAQVVAVLDPRIYNPVLADSWDSGWRYQSDGLRLIEPPQVRVLDLPGMSKSFLDAVIMRRPEGLIERQLFGECGTGASSDDFRVHAAVVLGVRKSMTGGNRIDLMRGGLDLGETFVPAEQFSSCALTAMGVLARTDEFRREILTEQVNSSLVATSKKMASDPQPIVEGLALPDALLGMRLKLLRATLQNGKVYLQFKLDGVDE